MSVRACSKCHLMLPLDQFQRDRQKSSGFRPECKACAREIKLVHYRNNKAAHRARAREWEKKNRARINAGNRLKIRNDPELQERRRKQAAEWKAKNPEKVRAQEKLWMQNNRGAHVAKGALARARRRKAAPPWLTIEQRTEIKRLYDLAANLRHHVDHICPIAGQNVCGLHVPWNLQVIPPRDNMVKGNRHVAA